MNQKKITLPQDIKLEKIVLGALMIDNKAMLDISDFMHEDVFYCSNNKIIYIAIKELYLANKPIDLLTVANQLKKQGKLVIIGGDLFLVNLTQQVSSSANIEYHARILVQKYILRELIIKSTQIIKDCYEEKSDALELLDKSFDNINEIVNNSIQAQEVLLNEIIDTQIEKGKKIFEGKIQSGLPTPIHKLTQKTGGWRTDELIIIAARPGMGKTAFALKNAIEIAKSNTPVAFFSLEMSKEQLTNRILSMEAKIDNSKFNITGLSPEDIELLQPTKNLLSAMPLFIDDTPSLSIEHLQLKAKRLKNKHKIQLVVVDYLQLMTSNDKKGNREQEISKISRGLKQLAKSIDVPVIALSQLSRSVETRGGSKRPLLSDLRESGAIEQDADLVMFLYRPEYYQINQWDEDYNHQPTENECEYIVAKNRNGGLIRNRMSFEGRYTLFSDLEYKDDFDTFEKELLNNNQQ